LDWGVVAIIAGSLPAQFSHGLHGFDRFLFFIKSEHELH